MGIIPAYRFLFSNPRWAMNLLMCSVCAIIPILGMILLCGYVADLMASLVTSRRDGYPEFTFDQFQRYLRRGLMPFFVSLVVILIAMVALYLVIVPLACVIIALAFYSFPDSVLPWIIGFATLVIAALAYAIVAVILTPLQIRPFLTLNFKSAFDWRFTWDFIRRTWPAILWRNIGGLLNATVLILIGYAACCLGIYPAMALVILLGSHTYAGLYELYLERGGTEIPLAEPPLPTELGAGGPGFEVLPPR